MSVKKQWKLREGDIVVMEGVDSPGIVVSVDKEDAACPTQVRFRDNRCVSERLLWGHPPIIRRCPRVGEQVVIKRLTDKDSHCYSINTVVTVIRIDIAQNQELECESAEGVTQWVYEAGVKRVKKGKAGA